MHRCLRTAFTVLIAASCIVFSRSAFADDDAAIPIEAKLVAKGDGYLVHVLSGEVAPVFALGLPKRLGILNQSTAVIHTCTKSGEMQCLFASGVSSVPGPPMGIDRIHHVKWHLVDASVSGDRLFLLTWHASDTVMVVGEPLPPPRFDKGQYDLAVFNASDGTKLTSIKLTGDSLPESPPPIDVDNGALQIKGDKITVFKQVLQFDGEQLHPAK